MLDAVQILRVCDRVRSFGSGAGRIFRVGVFYFVEKEEDAPVEVLRLVGSVCVSR